MATVATDPLGIRDALPQPPDTLAQVRDYYGSTLQGSKDLKTSACCCAPDSASPEVREVLALVAPEVLERFYGCGSPLPPLLEGCTVLDLGCGTGRDCFVASKLVGPQGHVIGIDMTPEQIAVARRYEAVQAERFGYAAPNTAFLDGYIEDLAAAGIADGSVDVVISNCVINLSPAKEQVFREIYRVLKPGGELYFSDVFADRRLPREAQSDPVLRGECLGGALYAEDFRRLLARAGWADFRYMGSSPVSVDDGELYAKVGMVAFSSRTVRAFKLDSLEDLCEDYGQVAVYKGTIPGFLHHFDLDDHHRFLTGKPRLVCGNTAAMLSETRFAPHFCVTGDRSAHYGAFACGTFGGSDGHGGSACDNGVGPVATGDPENNGGCC
ncbi:MAG: methyltransferase domain-containing protein [Coriobacteriales bacterium]|jgi:SAM-dependent methyltransferase|nr:methyltransferase domain-containing protein [Coriobacteriales bacterium]